MNETFCPGPNEWQPLTSRIQPQSLKLSDEVATKINGRRDSLVTMMQERFGFTQQQAEDVLNDFMIRSR